MSVSLVDLQYGMQNIIKVEEPSGPGHAMPTNMILCPTTSNSQMKSPQPMNVVNLPYKNESFDSQNNSMSSDTSFFDDKEIATANAELTLPDYLDNNLDIVIVGINPSVSTAEVGHHYSGPGNHLSGLIPFEVTCFDDYKMNQFGIGFTNVCTRPTKGASELTRREMKLGAAILLEKMQKFKPKIAAFNGKGIYEAFIGNKNFSMGKQPSKLEGTDVVVFVMPSSSARCAQLPRAEDKLPFFYALRKLKEFLRGDIPHLDERDVVFSDYTEFRVTTPDPKSLRKAERRRKRKALAALMTENGGTAPSESDLKLLADNKLLDSMEDPKAVAMALMKRRKAENMVVSGLNGAAIANNGLVYNNALNPNGMIAIGSSAGQVSTPIGSVPILGGGVIQAPQLALGGIASTNTIPVGGLNTQTQSSFNDLQALQQQQLLAIQQQQQQSSQQHMQPLTQASHQSSAAPLQQNVNFTPFSQSPQFIVSGGQLMTIPNGAVYASCTTSALTTTNSTSISTVPAPQVSSTVNLTSHQPIVQPTVQPTASTQPGQTFQQFIVSNPNGQQQLITWPPLHPQSGLLMASPNQQPQQPAQQGQPQNSQLLTTAPQLVTSTAQFQSAQQVVNQPNSGQVLQNPAVLSQMPQGNIAQTPVQSTVILGGQNSSPAQPTHQTIANTSSAGYSQQVYFTPTASGANSYQLLPLNSQPMPSSQASNANVSGFIFANDANAVSMAALPTQSYQIAQPLASVTSAGNVTSTVNTVDANQLQSSQLLTLASGQQVKLMTLGANGQLYQTGSTTSPALINTGAIPTTTTLVNPQQTPQQQMISAQQRHQIIGQATPVPQTWFTGKMNQASGTFYFSQPPAHANGTAALTGQTIQAFQAQNGIPFVHTAASLDEIPGALPANGDEKILYSAL